jgi:cyclic dehypoxanthinyl futalosine synthase
MLAVSRLFLDNIQHIQASWLTQGIRLGQAALHFGADDMGSIMIEENVISAAGANTKANEMELRYQIRKAGFRPQQRDILYNYIERGAPEMDEIQDNSALERSKLKVC